AARHRALLDHHRDPRAVRSGYAETEIRRMTLASANKYVVVGLGKTGLSCARFLQRQGLPFVAVDTRANPPGAAQFAQEFPGVATSYGPLNAADLVGAKALVMSPGVALAEPAVQEAIAQGVAISGDIDLFAKAVKAPL